VNTIALKLTDPFLKRLEAAARAWGTTKSAVVRQCLEQSLDARPTGGKATCYDLAADLAGSLKGLPRDLATNPRHMERLARENGGPAGHRAVGDLSRRWTAASHLR
jgi:predicted transcriptional regulator